MLNAVKTDEQAEVARVFKDVRERATGFESAANAIDAFMKEMESDSSKKEVQS